MECYEHFKSNCCLIDLVFLLLEYFFPMRNLSLSNGTKNIDEGRDSNFKNKIKQIQDETDPCVSSEFKLKFK